MSSLFMKRSKEGAMLKQDLDYFAYYDLESNYRALVQAVYGNHRPKLNERVRTNICSKKENIKCAGHSQKDICEMARLRESGDNGKPMTYKAVGKLFRCTDHVVYATLKRHGLLKKGLKGGNRSCWCDK